MRPTTIDNENHLRGKQSANPPLGMVCASWRDGYHTPMKFSGMSEPDCETSVERGVLSQANSRNEAIIEFLHQHLFIRRGFPLRPRVVACSLRIPKRGVLQLTGAFFSVPAPYPNFQAGHVRHSVVKHSLFVSVLVWPYSKGAFSPFNDLDFRPPKPWLSPHQNLHHLCEISSGCGSAARALSPLAARQTNYSYGHVLFVGGHYILLLLVIISDQSWFIVANSAGC